MKQFNKEKTESKKMKVGDWGHHGDVVLEKIESLPDDFESFEKTSSNELALGEATGHLHQICDGEFDLRINPTNNSERYLKVVKPVALRHQEHKEVIIEPGIYKSRIQIEYDPFEKIIREVMD